jgi:glutamyl-tRNA synthetase
MAFLLIIWLIYVNDHDMGTTHTIRGEEWLLSTPLHVLIYKAFGWDMPEFAHLPILY